MLTLLAHAGHSHKYSAMSYADYHIPIIVGLIFLAIVLSATIIVLLTYKHPKPTAKPATKPKSRKK